MCEEDFAKERKEIMLKRIKEAYEIAREALGLCVSDIPQDVTLTRLACAILTTLNQLIFANASAPRDADEEKRLLKKELRQGERDLAKALKQIRQWRETFQEFRGDVDDTQEAIEQAKEVIRKWGDKDL